MSLTPDLARKQFKVRVDEVAYIKVDRVSVCVCVCVCSCVCVCVCTCACST